MADSLVEDQQENLVLMEQDFECSINRVVDSQHQNRNTYFLLVGLAT